MKLENQVCSLELAKQLKELGVKQKGLFSWFHWWEGSSDELAGKDLVMMAEHNHDSVMFVCSAFTVAELGEILPEEVKTEELDFHFRTKKRKDNHWIVKYVGRKGSGTSFRYNSLKKNCEGEKGKTEADARAKMLIYLLENNLIKNK